MFPLFKKHLSIRKNHSLSYILCSNNLLSKIKIWIVCEEIRKIFITYSLIVQVHKSFNLIGSLSSPVNPPKIRNCSYEIEDPELHPLEIGQSISGNSFLEIILVPKVSSLIKNNLLENPPAPSWSLSLGSISPPKITIKLSFPC